MSVINAVNIRQIMNDLMAYSALSVIARDMGMCLFSSDFRQLVCDGSIEDMNFERYKQYLTELPIDLVAEGDSQVVRAHKKELLKFINEKFKLNHSDNSVVGVQKCFEETIAKTMDKFFGVQCRPRVQAEGMGDHKRRLKSTAASRCRVIISDDHTADATFI